MDEIVIADLLKQIKELNTNIASINKEVFNAKDAAE